MARNGSGTYSLPEAPFVAGTVISSTAVNSDLSDIANALTGSIAANGETPITANLPMSGYRHTGVANASARTDYAAAGQVQDGAFIWCGTAGGTADALTLTPTPAIAAYAAGQVFRFTAGESPNSTATTVAVSGLSAKAIQNAGAALTGGEIAAGRQYEILYDGTQFQLLAFAPVAYASNAQAQAGSATNVAVTPANLTAAVAMQGLQTVWIPAVAAVSRTTNGAAAGTVETTTNKVMFKTLDFDATTLEYAQFAIRMPKSWNEGTVTAAFTWSHPATTTNFGVVWAIQGVAISDDDAGDAAFGTAQTVTDTGGTTNDIYISSATSAVTIAGTPAAEDWVVFQVYRDASSGSDTLAVDARLHGVTLYFTTNAATDA